MKYIQLTKGERARVCDCHYNLVKDLHWYCYIQKSRKYALSAMYEKGTHKVLRMHTIINITPEGLDTDHINGNGLDNRCSNLRSVTRSQNNMNMQPRLKSTSKYKGVSWDKVNNKWVAQIHFKNKTTKIGRFKDEREAAQAYNNIAKSMFGEYSWQNKV